jgi:hypothetical protein
MHQPGSQERGKGKRLVPPADYTLVQIADTVIGWGLATAAMTGLIQQTG